MLQIRLHYGIIFILLGLMSCGSETIEVGEGDLQKSFFPLEVGNEWIYLYDSVIYDLSRGTVDTSSGFIREIAAEVLMDGRMVIDRFQRFTEEDQWILQDRWTAIVEDTRAVKTEENLSFIKLVFPPTEGARWEGNALFDESTEIVVAGEALRPYFNWRYEIVSSNQVLNLEDKIYENVVGVQQISDTSNIDLRHSVEYYADGIGLVKKEMAILDCQCNGISSSVPWEEKAEKGFILHQELISFSQ